MLIVTTTITFTTALTVPIKSPKIRTEATMCTIAKPRAPWVVGPMSPSPTVLAVIMQW